MGPGYCLSGISEVIDDNYKVCDVELYEITTERAETSKYSTYLSAVERIGKYDRTNIFKCNSIYRKYFSKLGNDFLKSLNDSDCEKIQQLIKAQLYEITGKRSYRFEENRYLKILVDIDEKQSLNDMQLWDLHQILFCQRYNTKYTIPYWGPKEDW